jgi:anti-anti-sigma factor
MSTLQTTRVDDILSVQFKDTEIRDHARASEIGRELLEQVGKADGGKLLLDLRGVKYFASAMLGQVFWLYNKCKAEKVRLRVCNVEPELKSILDVINFGQVIEVSEDVVQARLAFSLDQPRNPAGLDERTAEAYRSDADAGNAEAQYQLARCYDEGRGVEQNAADAFAWYMKAAEQGHPEAEYSVGRSHSFGIHVPQNYDKALVWYRRAADRGHPEAQYILGVSHQWGISVPQDSDSAIHWFRRAAENGHEAAAEALREIKLD